MGLPCRDVICAKTWRYPGIFVGPILPMFCMGHSHSQWWFPGGATTIFECVPNCSLCSSHCCLCNCAGLQWLLTRTKMHAVPRILPACMVLRSCNRRRTLLTWVRCTRSLSILRSKRMPPGPTWTAASVIRTTRPHHNPASLPLSRRSMNFLVQSRLH